MFIKYSPPEDLNTFLRISLSLPRGHIAALAAFSVVSLAGCSSLQTRPGNPDSYNVGLSGENYYETSGLKKLEWPTIEGARTETISDLQRSGVPIPQVPPIYKATEIPREIWQARGAAWNMHLKYLAASYKAQKLQDVIAVPLFGTLIATAALGVAGGGTTAVAGTGLGGTSVYAGYTYLHPDKDISSDQIAAFALVCEVDQSLPLRTMSAVPLMLDKAALQDALDQLNSDSASLVTSATDKSAKQAVTDAQNAANTTMTNLDHNITAFENMPSLIYTTMDQIDKAAQTGGGRTLDLNAIRDSLNASATNKSDNTAAKDQVGKAKTQSSGVASTGSSKLANSVTKNKASSTKNLDNVTTSTAGDAKSALADPSTNPAPDTGKSGSNQTKATNLKDALTNSRTNDLQKLLTIANDANEDLAVIDYHAVAANIQTCTSGQSVTPAVTQPSTPVATADKTGS